MRSRFALLSGRAIIRQAGALSAARVAAAAFSFVWFIVASRYLDVSEFGDFTLLLALGAFTSVIADAGLPLVLTEEVSRNIQAGRQSLWLVIRRRIALSFWAGLATYVLYVTAAEDRSLWIPAAFALSLVATSVHTSASAALRGLGSVTADSLNEVGSRLVLLGLGAILLQRGLGVLGVVLLYALVEVASSLVLLTNALFRLPPGDPANSASFAVRRVAPIALAAFLGLAYYRIDVWLLGVMTTSQQVAEYSIAVKLLDGMMIPAGALAVVSAAVTAKETFGDALRRLDQVVFKLSLLLLPAVIALFVMADRLVRSAFGPEYVEAANALRIISVSAIPAAAALIWSPLLVLRANGFVRVALLALVGNVVLNLLLIPPLGAEGAAAVTLVCQVAYGVAIRYRLRRSGRSDSRRPEVVVG